MRISVEPKIPRRTLSFPPGHSLDAFSLFWASLEKSLICRSDFTKWPQFPGLAPAPSPAAPLTAALPLPDLSSPSPPRHRALAREKSSGTQGPDQRQKALKHRGASLRCAWPELGSQSFPVCRSKPTLPPRKAPSGRPPIQAPAPGTAARSSRRRGRNPGGSAI